MAPGSGDGQAPGPLRERVFALIADGRMWPAHQLAARLGVSPSAVRGELAALAELGLDLERRRGRGYRLRSPCEPLRAELIGAALSAATGSRIELLDVRFEVDSTNRRLLQRGAPPDSRVHACVAEYQHGGRGRRGRRWLSAPGAGLCLSLGWRHVGTRADLNGLSLALGVAAASALGEAGEPRVRLKWPNDLYLEGAKLGGILVETGGSDGALAVVAGLGINVTGAPSVEQASVALGAAAGAARNRLCAALIDGWAQAFEVFRDHGLAPFRSRWEMLDMTRGREVTVSSGAAQLRGIAVGVDADGALMLRSADRTHLVYGGEVSLRVAA